MRNGLQKFALLAHSMCRLFGVFRGSIIGAVNGSSLNSDDKAKLIGLINTVDTACSAIDLIMVKYER